jgi:hypothetical protein
MDRGRGVGHGWISLRWNGLVDFRHGPFYGRAAAALWKWPLQRRQDLLELSTRLWRLPADLQTDDVRRPGEKLWDHG